MNLSQKIINFKKFLHSKQHDISPDIIEHFEKLFPTRFFSRNLGDIKTLALEYCYSDIKRCPICNASLVSKKLHKRSSRHFLGCSQFPQCNGSRSYNGTPFINDAMREFLMKKTQTQLEINNADNIRFQKLKL
jgi:hypothetical protein